ncbi:MAG: hypothetical protein IJT73_08245 [Selenomonadaceae bacterium]|nr:hypothetical protein [Selenomonadaceae bacterium]
MGKLSNIARNVLGAGGEYISLDSIIATYPEGVTINGAFVRKTQNGDKPCFTFAEDANKYFYAVSGDIAALYERWLGGCDNSIDELNDCLRYENIKIKIQKKRTKAGKTYTKAWIVDTIEKPRDEEVPEFVDEETGEIAPF